MAQATVLDFCLDEIGKIDWVQNFVNLRELTIANNSVIEIEVSPTPVVSNGLIGYRQVSALRKGVAQLESDRNHKMLLWSHGHPTALPLLKQDQEDSGPGDTCEPGATLARREPYLPT